MDKVINIAIEVAALFLFIISAVAIYLAIESTKNDFN